MLDPDKYYKILNNTAGGLSFLSGALLKMTTKVKGNKIIESIH